MKQTIMFTISIILFLIFSPSFFFAKAAVKDSILEKQPEIQVSQKKDEAKISEKIIRKSKKLCKDLAFLTIETGDSYAFRKITKDKDFNANFVDKVGMSLLHYSVKYNFLDGVNILLVYGAKVNPINDLGMIPLHYAVKNGNIEITRNLLSYGAGIRMGNKFGLTPILLLFFSRKEELEKMLCDPNEMLDLLMSYESEYGQKEYLKLKELFGSNPAFTRF